MDLALRSANRIQTPFRPACYLFACMAFILVASRSVEAQNSKSLDEARQRGRQRSTYLSAASRTKPPEKPTADLETYRITISPILSEHCADCHTGESGEGNVQLDRLNPDLVSGDDVNWWLEILSVVGNGEMPPADAVELPDNQRAQLVQWLSQEIQTASLIRRTEGGHTSFRRMTRYEYNYAMQDLLRQP